MNLTIITATYNNEATIADCLDSVCNQSHLPFEHLIIDGQSTDGTLQIIQSYSHVTVISEPDKGIYDALNKGIRAARGDIIGFLHADDMYASSNVLQKVLEVFETTHCDAVYGDLNYVHPQNTKKIIRKWVAGKYSRSKLRWGWMPPHPTFFVKKEIYQKYGLFDLAYTIAADYELMLRFLWKYRITPEYLPIVMINMRTGGKSNRLSNIYLKMKEDYRAIRQHKMGGMGVLLSKNVRKIHQFFT